LSGCDRANCSSWRLLIPPYPTSASPFPAPSFAPPRRKIRDRILAIMASGRLPQDGLVARLVAHFGDNTEAVVDNVITVLCERPV
jgi:hypothetical protein